MLLPACTLTYIRWNRVWRLEATNHRRPTSPKKWVCACIQVCVLTLHPCIQTCVVHVCKGRKDLLLLYRSTNFTGVVVALRFLGGGGVYRPRHFPASVQCSVASNDAVRSMQPRPGRAEAIYVPAPSESFSV